MKGSVNELKSQHQLQKDARRFDPEIFSQIQRSAVQVTQGWQGGQFSRGSQERLMFSPQSRFEVWCCWWMCREPFPFFLDRGSCPVDRTSCVLLKIMLWYKLITYPFIAITQQWIFLLSCILIHDFSIVQSASSISYPIYPDGGYIPLQVGPHQRFRRGWEVVWADGSGHQGRAPVPHAVCQGEHSTLHWWTCGPLWHMSEAYTDSPTHDPFVRCLLGHSYM